MEEIFVSGQKSAVEFGIDLQRRWRWRDEDHEDHKDDENDEDDDEDDDDENDDCFSKAKIENTT